MVFYKRRCYFQTLLFAACAFERIHCIFLLASLFPPIPSPDGMRCALAQGLGRKQHKTGDGESGALYYARWSGKRQAARRKGVGGWMDAWQIGRMMAQGAPDGWVRPCVAIGGLYAGGQAPIPEERTLANGMNA